MPYRSVICMNNLQGAGFITMVEEEKPANASMKVKFSMTQMDCTHTKGGLCLPNSESKWETMVLLPTNVE